MVMTVKSKIATFEAQNEEVRKTVIVSPPRNNKPTDVTSSFSTASTTSMASESRKSRLQRTVVGNSPQPKPSPEVGGLRERRQSRQERQRERLGLAAKPASNNSSGATTSGSSSRPQAQKPTTTESRSLFSNSRREQQQQQQSKPSSQRPSSYSSSGRSKARQPSPEQNRKFVNTMSTESDEGDFSITRSLSHRSEKLAKAKRMQKMNKIRSPNKAKTEAPMMRESDQYFNKLLTPHLNDEDDDDPYDQEEDDDDITETSVRQIMRSDEEKSRLRNPEPVLTRASTSSFDTDGDSMHGGVRPNTNTAMSAFLQSHSQGSVPTQGSSFPRTEDDERTFDYGDRDDASQESLTYEQRKERERKAQEAKERQNENGISPLLNKEDMEFIGKNLDTPMAKTAAGVAAAATVGGLLLGPVGLLIGAAAVGLGVGIMQIPEEQRKNVQDKATEAVKKAQESAISASEKLTSTCAASCDDAGVTEHIPREMTKCFSQPEGDDIVDDDEGDDEDKDEGIRAKPKETEKGPAVKKAQQTNGVDTRNVASPGTGRAGKRRAAVLRHGRITPVNEIHSLQPSQQPRAWLDVMASAETSRDEKSEALEEINILAKDKRHARFFLEEGILDSVLWILNHYFATSTRKPDDPQEYAHAKLAATCCITLGKAHCAAVHTGGDLLLMSMYERGSVPEERQLAQMLYEVPHHVQLGKSAGQEDFVLKTITMPQAEELAMSITQMVVVSQ